MGKLVSLYTLQGDWGLDRAFSDKGKRSLPVYRARFQSGGTRIKLMQKHRKQGGGPRVFFADVMPGMLYGAECITVPDSAISSTRRAVASVAKVRPPFVSKACKLLGIPTGSDQGTWQRLSHYSVWRGRNLAGYSFPCLSLLSFS